MATSRKQWQVVVEELQARSQREPSSPMYRVRLGNALERIGEHEAALDQYKVAAQIFLRTGFARHARSVFRMILDRNPADREARKGYQAALRDCFEETDEDSENVLNAIEENPEMPIGVSSDPDAAELERQYWDRLANGSTASRGMLFEPNEEGLSPVNGKAVKPPPPPPTGEQAGAPPPPPPPGQAEAAPPVAAPTNGHTKPAPPVAPDVDLQPEAGVLEDELTLDPELTPTPTPLPFRPIFSVSVENRRRAPRVPWDADVQIGDGESFDTGRGTSLSATGIYVSGVAGFRPGDLVDLSFRNPGDDSWAGSGRGQVARVREASNGSEPGIGIALLWVDPPTELWMLRSIEEALGRAEKPPEARPSTAAMAPQHGRAAPRAPVVVPARVVSKEFEAVGWSLDLSEVGSFLAVPQLFARGEHVQVWLWLDRHADPLVIRAEIVESRRASATRRSGVAVRFSPPSDDERLRLEDAVRQAAQMMMTGN